MRVQSIRNKWMNIKGKNICCKPRNLRIIWMNDFDKIR